MKFLYYCIALCFTVHHATAYQYETKTFRVPVDHFSFANNDSFEIRYLVNDTFWRKPDGPIFFYTGNEGAIELFCENTGFIWDIAPQFKALVVFAEHRYYGHSLPYGNESFKDPKHSGYLTSEQALADYVDLIRNLTWGQKPGRRSTVIAFGGSYGGMLAAYIRIKYPHIVTGAIAASAPIWSFTDLTPCEAFNRIVTADYSMDNKTCAQVIRKSWDAIDNVTSTDDGKAWLSSNWTLCQKLNTTADVKKLKDWLMDAYTNLAMANYPYPANFLAELPGYPVREVCGRIQAPLSPPKQLLTGLFPGISVYINYTGKARCMDISGGSAGLGLDGWDYQACTEMVMPMCADGVNDMFQPQTWDIAQYTTDCWNKWKVKPQPHLVEKIYGGKNLQYISNIIFSNGLLDPWSSGGVLKNLSKTLISVLIPEGAHHLDLRAANEQDPESVKNVRDMYRKYIRMWISNNSQKTSRV